MSVQGNNLSDVKRVNIGGIWIGDIEVTKSSVSSNVPANIPLGMQEVILVFAGSDRASAEINVIALPTISYFTPKAVGDGDEVTILGGNLDNVTSISIGTVEATITSQDKSTLKFTVPNGVSSDLINMLASTGSTISSSDPIIACTANPDHLACLPVVNINGSFEDSPVGAADGVTGWGGLNGSLASGEITDEEHYDGFKCYKVTVNDLGANPWNIQPNSNMPVDPTATYHVSMWVKGSGLPTVMFAIDEGGSPGYFNWQSPQEEINMNEWTEISYDFSPESEAISNGGDETARFAISMSYDGNIGGVMYFDNLRVVKVE